MATPGQPPSKRDRIRDEAECVLRAARTELHVSLIAAKVLTALGLAQEVSDKTVNTCLHDDPQRRFVSVGKGTWKLSLTPRAPS